MEGRRILLIGAVAVAVATIGTIGYGFLTDQQTSPPATSLNESSLLEGVDLDKLEQDLPRDAIPPLDFPKYDDPEDAFPNDSDLVLGVEINGDARAYPLKIMNFHEIVNEEIGREPVVVTYCPLCRSGLVFSRETQNGTLTFGNTGALYESAMVMYDRETESLWWQVPGLAIKGPLRGSTLELLPSMVTEWGEWKELHPDTLVLSEETGHDRPYHVDAFLAYDEDVESTPRFPHSEPDPRLPPKTKVVGLSIGGEAKAYPITGSAITVVNDEVGGVNVAVFIDPESEAAAVHTREVDGEVLTFTTSEGRFVDEETKSTWSIEGEAVDGELSGIQLKRLESWHSYWFAWTSAFPDTDLQGTRTGPSSESPNRAA